MAAAAHQRAGWGGSRGGERVRSCSAPASGGTNGTGSPAAAAAATGPARATAPKAAAPTGPMRSEIDAIDLLDTAGAPVLKRLAPVVGGVLLLLIIFLIRRSRRS